LLRFVGAAAGTAITTYLLVLLLYPGQAYSLDVFFLFAVFLILGLSGSRSTFIILDRFYYRQRVTADGDRVLLVGAGDEGEMVLRWILRNPEIGYRPVGFVDDDQSLWGRSISSVEILGGSDKINAMIDDRKIEGIILTSTRFSTQPELQRIIDLCHQKSIWVRYLKFEFELIEAD
jgi:FlaA1/EpsC-like NDP-sugar epimerase